MEEKDPPETARELLGWVRFLREHGRPDAIAQKEKGVRDVVEAMHEEARKGRRDHYTAMAMFGMTADQLKVAILRARQVEEHLNRAGWRIGKNGKVARIRKGRGRDLLAECVWEIYSEKHADKGNTFPVRRMIAAELAPFFDEDDLDPKSGSPIYLAIYNREKRSR